MSQLSEYQKQILSELCITNWHVREPDLLELGPVDSTTITSGASLTNSSPATAPSTTAPSTTASSTTVSSATVPSSIPSKPARLDTVSASDRIAQMQAAIGSASSKTTPGQAASERAPSQTASERAPKTEPVSHKAVDQTSASAAEHSPEERASKEHASIELIPVEHEPPKAIAKPLKPEVLILESERLPISDIVAAATSLNLPYRVIAHDQELEFEYELLISGVQVSQVIAKENIIVESLSPQSKKHAWQALLKFNSALLKQTSSKQTSPKQTSPKQTNSDA